MILDGIFRKTNINLLDKSLDASSVRQRVRASNIANVATAGYQRREVSFEKELRLAMRGAEQPIAATHPRHISQPKTIENVQPKVQVVNEASEASGVNNVNIDYEMVELAKNQVFYTTIAQLLGRNFRGLRSAIRGRSV